MSAIWLKSAKIVRALLLTHAHEDHFGALLDLWPRLNIPIYATPFTAALLRGEMRERAGGAGRFR